VRAIQVGPVGRLPSFQRAHHLIPDVQVFIHQPINHAAHFFVNFLRDFGENFLLKLRLDFVALGQVADIGQAQRIIKEILSARFKALQHIFDLRQARRSFGLQRLIVSAQHPLQVRHQARVSFQFFGLLLVQFLRLAQYIFGHPQRAVQLQA